MAATSALTGLEPRSFWAHFEALTRIARPSRHEEPVIEHVRAWAADRGYELVQDSGRNLVVRVPATPGREGAPTVVLQGHLDMVCERDPSSQNDPARSEHLIHYLYNAQDLGYEAVFLWRLEGEPYLAIRRERWVDGELRFAFDQTPLGDRVQDFLREGRGQAG